MTKKITITTGLLGNRKSFTKEINYTSDKGLKIALLKTRSAVYNNETGVWVKDDISFASDSDKWLKKRNNEMLCIPANRCIKWDEIGKAIL